MIDSNAWIAIFGIAVTQFAAGYQTVQSMAKRIASLEGRVDHLAEWKQSVDETAKDHRKFAEELLQRIATLEATLVAQSATLARIERNMEKGK
jgi:TolA-binding protein